MGTEMNSTNYTQFNVPTPEEEQHRLEALRIYEILNTEPEPVFDDLTKLAAQIANVKMAAIGFLDADILWLKSKTGIQQNSIPREHSFCSYAIMQPGLFEVEDASKDERFQNFPTVKNEPFIKFYAGIPLITPEGYAIGTFCIMDTEPKRLSPELAQALKILAHQVMTHLELRRHWKALAKAFENQKKTEQALKKSESFYLSLVENLPQNIFRKDIDGKFSFANHQFCKLLGKPLDEIIGKTDYDLYPKELADKFRADDAKILETLTPIDTIEENINSDGSKSYVHVIKTPILSQDGKPIGIQGIFWDVTKRILTEQELAKERNLLRALLDYSPDRIYFKDKDSRFILCSKTVVSGLGLKSAEEAIGKSDFDFFTEEHAKPAYEDEQEIIRTGIPKIGIVEKETWIDGKETWALTTKMPLRDSNGNIIGTFGITKDITELKKIEQQLEYERDLLKQLLDNAPDNIYFKDLQSRFIRAGKSLADKFGLKSPEEAYGKTDFDFYTDEHARQAYEDEQEIIRTGIPKIGIVEKETWPDGHETWGWTTKMPLRDKNGNIIGTFGITKDITELKKIEQQLEYERDLLKQLMDNSPDNIYFKDLQSRFIRCGKSLAEKFGLKSPEEAIGKSDFDFFTEEHARQAYEDEQEIIRTGIPKIGIVEKETWPDGHETWGWTTKMPLRDKNGNIIGTFGITKDITELKRTQEDLAYERDLLRSLLDNVPDCIYFKDLQSRFILCSKALADRFGLASSEEAIGKTDFDFFTEEHARPAFEDEQEIIRTGRPVIGKLERETWPDGRETWALTSKLPLRDKHGNIIGTFGISKDVTALKLAETELQKARDAALESTRLKSEFLANMSHEIRTPMNAIIGMTGLLLETNLTDEQRDFAETVRVSAEALLAIINDILDFSKIEAGKLNLEATDFDLCETVESTVELLAERAQSKGLELASWIHTDVPTQLRGDPGRLRQVLTNLIGNAVKFTEHGEVVVRVTKDYETDTHAVLRFRVSDTGIGIAPSALPRLFQAFSQADGSMTRKYGGTGLGLAICKQLVELMGGQIGVESKLGEGSTFWFTVRLEKQPSATPKLSIEEKMARMAGLRVLIVDDNTTNRQILHYQIIAWKMRNGHAASGPEALEILRRAAAAGDPYDLAILDMQMPDMDGLTLAREIKKDPRIASTRLVMLTSLMHRENMQTLKEAGIEACLIKPVKQSKLFDCIANLFLLPVEPVKTQAIHPTPQKEAATAPITSNLYHILLAEDNAVNQKVALRQLKKLGFNADAVANGIEVLDALERIQYDIIIMDCQMPEMDGYEATRRIRQHEKTEAALGKNPKHVHIIAMTANALQGDREKCIEAGMDDYVSKPVRLPELEAALRRAVAILEGKKSAPDSSPIAETLDDEILDPTVINGLRELRQPGEPDPLAEVAELFIGDTPPRLQQIETALKNRDFQNLAALAHSLKGSASNLGAKQMANLCLKLEKAAKTGDQEQSMGIAAQIKEEFDRVKKALELEIQKDNIQSE